MRPGTLTPLFLALAVAAAGGAVGAAAGDQERPLEVVCFRF